MALQTSGAISLIDIATEFGGTAPHSMSEYYGAAAGIPASGAINMKGFYGKSSQFTFTISSNQTNASLYNLAVNAGWDGSSNLQVTINSGVYISSNSTGTPALTVNGSFPAGVTLVNNGYIVGKGGNGGQSATTDFNPPASVAGYAGGGALSVSSAITIQNNGTIGGGGGGGGCGGMGSNAAGDTFYRGGGGGGGRSGTTSSSGAALSGASGTTSGGGAGGGGQSGIGGTGGTGGNWGAAGGTGGAGAYQNYFNVAYRNKAGGSAGYAVSGNGNITWSATGTRLGAIS
jgi:hypothetical protein